MRLGFPIKHRLEIGTGSQIHVTLHVPIAGKRTVSDPGRYIANRCLKLVVRHNLINQAEPMSLSRIDDVAEKEELFCLRCACVLSQKPCRPKVASVTNLRVCRSE